ncbi:a4c82a13-a3d1-47be-8447-19bb477f167b [Thermothielavioides terrestris]|uniref:A4c82a13-a3d1-47be-8447-19bb477f167b n=1 Tax=Thermothielavioides terrestris TaxID=2587410 RepID=A0A446BH43_9PEZI|nr:a4c82a13-a3d1-47be-8447-19bb477f167b [Thermothielavioides terrestris]
MANAASALAAIRDADLPHPHGPLLEAFVHEFVDNERAASYLLQRCSADPGSGGLTAFLTDWIELISAFSSNVVDRVHDRRVIIDITARDGAKCGISGLPGSLLDPLIVVRIFSGINRQLSPSQHEMLAAFLTPSLRDWALHADTGDGYQNLWLVRRSAAEAFLRGYVRLKFRDDRKYMVCINRACGHPPPGILDELPNLRTASFTDHPPSGNYLYGPTCGLGVQRLPFGLYLKKRSLEDYGTLKNEYRALELVRRHTDVPVPRPLDLVSDDKRSYLLTSAVPGCHVGLRINNMSDEEVSSLVRDLRRWLEHIRSIPKRVAPEYEISNAAGEGCYDFRILAGVDCPDTRGVIFGPYKNEDDFNSILQCGALPDVAHRAGHKIVFTHGDINMHNVMVKDGKLSGIVDWECAGWYPEYWEYTKAHYVTKHHWHWRKMVDEAFRELGDYRDELATEKKLWEYCF